MEQFQDAEAAKLYSQLTGVLAGFAFTGLVLVLTHKLGNRGLEHSTSAEDMRERAALNRFLALLLASFLGLTVTSLGYAVVGAEGVQQIAAVEHVVVGVAFAASALALLLALLVMIRHLANADLTAFTHRLVARWTPFVAVTYVAAGAIDVGSRVNASWGIYALAGGAIALQVSAWLWTKVTKVDIDSWSDHFSVLASSVVAIAAVCSVAVPALSTASNLSGSAPVWTVWASLAIAGVGSAAFTVFCHRSQVGGLPVAPPPATPPTP